jgi:hypothetical protein
LLRAADDPVAAVAAVVLAGGDAFPGIADAISTHGAPAAAARISSARVEQRALVINASFASRTVGVLETLEAVVCLGAMGPRGVELHAMGVGDTFDAEFLARVAALAGLVLRVIAMHVRQTPGWIGAHLALAA